MPRLLALVALMAPRVVIVVLYFFTTWFQGIFDNLLWPILGFIFLPTTLIWYTAVQNWYGGEWGTLQIIGIVVALAVDVSPASGRRD
jgi:hypothetical protein